MGKSFKMSEEEVKATLMASGYSISGENRSGKVNLQGKCTSEVEEVLCKPTTKHITNKKVFVVYGHDTNARTQLEAMLRR